MDLRPHPGEHLRQNLANPKRPAAKEGPWEESRAAAELERLRLQVEVQAQALRDAQAELAAASQRYTELFDHLPVGCMSLTPAGQIVEANLTAASWLGLDRGALRGTTLARFMNPFDAGRFAAHVEGCLQAGAERTFETVLRTEEGAMIPVQLATRPTECGGRPGVAVTLSNLAQLKQAQQLMAEIRRERDVFGNSLSHDLRSPLVTIGTYAGILLADHAAALTPEMKDMVARMGRAAERMEATLRQLLVYNMLVSEEPALGRVGLDVVVQAVLRESHAQIEASGAQVEVEGPLPHVRGCPRLLAPALGNLMSNALKFVGPGEAPRVAISAEPRGEFIVLKVADRGIGIDPQHHERIFGLFDRLHGQSAYPGAGIGLAIVRRAVELMQGRAWVESGKGKGSCFYLMLPKA